MNDLELANEIERALDVLQPLARSDTLFSAPNAAPGCELRFSTLREAIAALRRGHAEANRGIEIRDKSLTIAMQEQQLASARADEAERQADLAQTEIKGHMRVEDELKLELARSGAIATENIAALTQALVRIAELEKDAARLDWLHAELKLTIAHALHWPVTPQDTVSFRAQIDKTSLRPPRMGV